VNVPGPLGRGCFRRRCHRSREGPYSAVWAPVGCRNRRNSGRFFVLHRMRVRFQRQHHDGHFNDHRPEGPTPNHAEDCRRATSSCPAPGSQRGVLRCDPPPR
jgi:hypothetical protein